MLPTHLPPPSCTHAQSCNPMDFSPPDSSVHGFFQARILEWFAISFSKSNFNILSLQYLLTLLTVIKSAFSSCWCLTIQLDIYSFFMTPVFYSISFNKWHCLRDQYILKWLAFSLSFPHCLCFPGDSAGKEFVCNVGNLGSIPGLGRSPEGVHGIPLHYSCLENPHGQKSLADYSPWCHKELDTTEQLFVANKKTEGCFLKFPEEWDVQKCLSLSFWYRWNCPVWGYYGFCPTVLWFWILMFENILNFILRR